MEPLVTEIFSVECNSPHGRTPVEMAREVVAAFS